MKALKVVAKGIGIALTVLGTGEISRTINRKTSDSENVGSGLVGLSGVIAGVGILMMGKNKEKA